MRLLNNVEMLAVSGGDINGQDNPHSLTGNPGRDRNGGGSNNGGQSSQSGIQQIAAACPDGSWTYTRGKVDVSIGQGELTIEGPTASCDRGHNPNDSGGESDDGNDNGSDDD